ncbi:MAG TPA: glycosyltransferase family 2 protein [Phycisphaerae bacterium]|nr:glycosyltransferase family 2 protein [Phycisphaerae bacterium]
MISVIIPCHNQGKYLRTAVDSVMVQTRGDHEVVVVNDASSDNTEDVVNEVIAENPGRAVRLVNTEAQSGLSAARNLGISQAQGNYMLPLDADDFLHAEYLQRVGSVLDTTGVDIVSASRMNFGAVPRLVVTQACNPKLLPVYNQLGYCSMYRKTVWERAGGYSVNYPRMGYEDWEFWQRCAMCGCKFGNVPEILWYYRDRADGMAHGALRDDEYLMARMVTRLPQCYAPKSVERAFRVIEETQDEDSTG